MLDVIWLILQLLGAVVVFAVVPWLVFFWGVALGVA